MNWLWKEWANVLRVSNDGVPIVGFTWYSLTDQVDWDSALRENNGNVNALGLYDLDRKIRPVGSAYQKLIADWRRGAADPERLPAGAHRDARAGAGSCGNDGAGRNRRNRRDCSASQYAVKPEEQGCDFPER